MKQPQRVMMVHEDGRKMEMGIIQVKMLGKNTPWKRFTVDEPIDPPAPKTEEGSEGGEGKQEEISKIHHKTAISEIKKMQSIEEIDEYVKDEKRDSVLDVAEKQKTLINESKA